MVLASILASPLKKSRKAQAATEYIHTYGWIFLSVLMILSVLYYYNTTKTDFILPLECSFLSGMDCLDSDTDDTLLSVVVVNGFGFTLSNITMNITGTCNSTANTSDGNIYSNQNVLLENQQATYVFECQNLTNMKVTERINMGYVSLDSGEAHIKVGKIQYSPTG